jgi:hypothetical protein
VPAVSRVAACTTQAPESRAEPVAYADVDQFRTVLAAKPVDARLRRNNATGGGGVELMPHRPRQATPMPTCRIPQVLVLRYITAFCSMVLHSSCLAVLGSAPHRGATRGMTATSYVPADADGIILGYSTVDERLDVNVATALSTLAVQ